MSLRVKRGNLVKINAFFTLRDCHAAPAMTPNERDGHALGDRNDNVITLIAFTIILKNQ